MRAASLLLLVAALLWTIYPAALDPNGCRRLLAVHRMAALGVVAFNCYLLAQGRGFVEVENKSIFRFGGLLVNPIQMSTFVVLTTPSCLLGVRERGWRSWHGLVFAGLMVSLVPTQSRGGLLAVLFGATLFLWLVSDPAARQRWITMALLTMPLVLLVDWQRSLARGEGDSLWSVFYTARIALWCDLLTHFKTSPWIGHGFGCSHLFNRLVVADSDYADMHVHNSYLEVFGDLGLLGAVLLGMLLVGIFLHCRRSLQVMDARTRDVHAAMFATVCSGLLDAVSDSWLLSVGNNSCVMFWVMVAALVARADSVVAQPIPSVPCDH
ncbi:MAG: O-antigen ligase family protein [Planctomycetes bacterium]|nr:O-antigen ligase family protein [Planctomycetota bacterium]